MIMSNVTNMNSVEMNKAAAVLGADAAKALMAVKAAELTPVQKLGGIGAVSGAVVGGAIGGAVGAAAGFVWQHKGKVAIAAAAVAAFVYREEITNFVTGIADGESAGGDAFM